MGKILGHLSMALVGGMNHVSGEELEVGQQIGPLDQVEALIVGAFM